MSDYEYTDEFECRLSLFRDVDGDVCLGSQDGLNRTTVTIRAADARAVAAALLKAAGSKHTILEPAKDRVVEAVAGGLSCGESSADDHAYTYARSGTSATTLRIKAARYIAIAEYIETAAQRDAEAEQRLQERRDKLADELWDARYYDLTSRARAAIDRIIALEDGQATA